MKTALLLSTLAAAACAGSIALDARPCPCADGWTCCPGANVCVAPGTACPQGAATASSTSLASLEGFAAYPRCFGQDADHLYWLDGDGRLAAVAKGGGPVAYSRFATPPQTMPATYVEGACTIAVDGDTLYATMFGLGKVLRVSTRTNGAWDLGAQGALVGELITPTALVVDEDAIWVAERDAGQIKRLPRTAAEAGAGAEAVVRVEGHISSLVSDGPSLVWVDDGGVRTMAKSGGAITTLSIGGASQVALVDKNALYVSAASGSLRWLPLKGGVEKEVSWNEPSESCPGEGWRPGVRAMTAFGRDVIFGDTTRVHCAPLGDAIATELFLYRSPCTTHDAEMRLVVADEARVYWSDRKAIWMRAR
jgi:hypothetical protein